MAKVKPTLNKKGKPRRTAAEKAANAKRYNNPTPRAQRAPKPVESTKTLAKGAVNVKQETQPDDPGVDRLSIEELKGSWATTPEWIKIGMIVLVLLAVMGFVF